MTSHICRKLHVKLIMIWLFFLGLSTLNARVILQYPDDSPGTRVQGKLRPDGDENMEIIESVDFDKYSLKILSFRQKSGQYSVRKLSAENYNTGKTWSYWSLEISEKKSGVLLKKIWNDQLPFKNQMQDINDDYSQSGLSGGLKFLTFNKKSELVYCAFTIEESRASSYEVFEIPVNLLPVRHIGYFSTMGGTIGIAKASPNGNALAIQVLCNPPVEQEIALISLISSETVYLPRMGEEINPKDPSAVPIRVLGFDWTGDNGFRYRLSSPKGAETFLFQY